MKILYEGDNLAYYDSKTLSRAGIYTVTWNIFCGLLNSNSYVSIYCSDPKKIYKVKQMIQNEFKDRKVEVIPSESIIISLCSKIFQRIDSNNINSKIIYKIIKQLVYWICKVYIYFSYKIKKNIEKYDVYFSPDKLFPNIIKRNTKILKTVFLHDIIPFKFPQYYPAMKTQKYWNQELIKGIKSVDFFFANSECTKNDYLELCSELKSEKILVTPLACDKKFVPKLANTDYVRDKYNIPKNRKYVFSLCNIDPRKNLLRVIRTFLQFVKKNNIEDLVFVIGGAKWDNFAKEFEQELDDSLIFYIGYVDDADLADLYSGALWFTYTSQYEGFGLPPLEAMSCGCPVITSNSSSLPEVVGGAGIQILWDNDEQHIEAYEKYYYDDDFRNTMAHKAFERSKMFSWDKTCELILQKMAEQCNMKDKEK